MALSTGISEDQLKRWATAPSETEETKCQNAVRMVKKAIEDHFGSKVSVFLQGSYKNRTNVRQDSDVDIVVRHNDIYFPDINALSEADKVVYNGLHSNATYTFSQFKNDVQSVLENAFSVQEVERKDKCIRVKANSYRVNADVVPCFTHKRYRTPYQVEAEGIELRTDSYVTIISFPDQHFTNGTSKNVRTSQMYKSIVRVFKNIRGELLDQGVITKDQMSSFFVECLVWNVPDSEFNGTTYSQITRNVIVQIYNDMNAQDKYSKYAEVSDLKWLFTANRTPLQAQQFVQAAYSLIGYQ